jgi:putative tricarboxylic transport membrane protein
VFEVGVMLVAGVIAYLLEANKFPIAPAILGVVLGGMLEENFITSMIKSDGNLGAFFSRPIALGLAALTLVVWFAPLVLRGLRSLRTRRVAA